MKWLLLLLVVGLVFFKMGQRRQGAVQRQAQAQAPARPQADGPVPMLRCTYCGVHLPAADALPGRGGQFCSANHRAEHEARQDPGR